MWFWSWFIIFWSSSLKMDYWNRLVASPYLQIVTRHTTYIETKTFMMNIYFQEWYINTWMIYYFKKSEIIFVSTTLQNRQRKTASWKQKFANSLCTCKCDDVMEIDMLLAKNIITNPLAFSLQWRHNGKCGVSNHQPYDCLLNCLFRRRSKKHRSSTSLAFVRGIHQWHKS